MIGTPIEAAYRRELDAASDREQLRREKEDTRLDPKQRGMRP